MNKVKENRITIISSVQSEIGLVTFLKFFFDIVKSLYKRISFLAIPYYRVKVENALERAYQSLKAIYKAA